jgi:hypothetical protein
MIKRKITPGIPENIENPRLIVIDQSTSDNWACANERAHRRR